MGKHKMDGTSVDPQEDLLNILKQKAPEIFSEDKIDFEKLRELLSGEIEEHKERYGLTWAGKSNCFREIQQPTTATLKPVRDESVDFDNTQNIFIEGENLETLKALQKSYYGKVKMIYIDPPYNTGNDTFIYPDRFQESRTEYAARSGEVDEEGNLTGDNAFRKNTSDCGHFHSNWLNMMYPRLFMARNLLRKDGVIFVSIDDNEVHNLRMVMDEIFGEQNFIANVVWQKKYTRSNDAKWFSDNHDHILVYGRDRELVALNNLPRTDSQLSAYSNPDNHPKGKWKATPLHAKSGNISSFSYTFKNGITWSPPLGTYPRYSKKTLKKLDDNNEIWFGKDGSATPSRKTFLSEAKEGVTPITIWTYDIAGHNHQANSELKKLGAGGLFTNPKPTLLVKLMLQLSTNAKKHDIVLDFFAGSCTTADAVMKLNTEDGGNRKFICAQIPESCDENSEPYKAGFKNIADVGKERIRRAGEKIKKGNEGKLDFDGDRLDLGFKVFRLDKSNFKIWRNDVEDENQLEKQMQMFVDNLRSGIVRENILYELILKSGLDLNVETEKKKANGKEYYSIDDGKLIICLEDKITQNLMDKIRTAEPEKVICLDRAFKGNDQLKTNTILQMESEEIEFKVI